MSRNSDLQNRVKVKLALAIKYERLAATSGGLKKKGTWLRRVAAYRNQARELSRHISD